MTPKPRKTPADYMVIGISPVLIMLLVGSLSFFLVQVFYRGEAVNSVRWVLFWFVFAVVLVSRIGIEQSPERAMIYGLLLAVATWVYLVHIHPAPLVGMVLLAIVWWSAHKLTWDCTLIDDDEDASGSGLLQFATETLRVKADGAAGPSKMNSRSLAVPSPLPSDGRGEGQGEVRVSVSVFDWITRVRKRMTDAFHRFQDGKARARAPHSPGRWVVYFSLIALPLFGIGQMLLPTDAALRRAGFAYLFVYLIAAVGLLLTTSFLGLRRYLRQRYLPMPGIIAFGWLKFGVGVAGVVFLITLLLPRPGVDAAWASLRYQLDYRIHQASNYALRLSPHGTGSGRPGDNSQNQNGSPASGDHGQKPTGHGGDQPGQNQSSPQAPSAPNLPAGIAAAYPWFRALFLLAMAILAGWWLFSRRQLLLEMIRSLIAAVRQFFRELFGLGWRWKRAPGKSEQRTLALNPFAAYQSPFLTGKDKTWSAEEVVLYGYEALQAWATEQGTPIHPEETAREFCGRLTQAYPDAAAELNRLAFLYGHAAYGSAMPAGCDLEPLRRLWRFMSEPAFALNNAA